MADSVKRSSLLTALIDPLRPTADHAEPTHRFTGGKLTWMVPLLIGVALLAVSCALALLGEDLRQQFYYSYLIGWTFCLSLALGALFIVLIKHLTKAHWIVVVRRIPETLVWSFPLLIVLFIPILIGLLDHDHGLYFHWTHDVANPASEYYDVILAGKVAYLNIPFFIVRMVFYFAIWTYLAYRLYTLSLRQDLEADPDIPVQQRRISAWGLPLCAVATAFSSYDLLMSLDPHWFSTIFGVYFFGGAFLAAFSFTAFMALLLQRSGMLPGVVTAEHYQDLGKLMFGFVVFWAYIAFSQYMLYWYGGIPEETVWFRHRLEHGWGTHSAALLVMHFILPFLLLLPRAVKRSAALLGIMAVWLLVMQWYDHHWLAMPVLHEHHAGFHWLDFSCWIGLFGVFYGAFVWRLGRHPLVPQGDPLLAKSLKFENA